MRHTLGTILAPALLVAALLTGCGSPDETTGDTTGDTTGTDPAATSTPTPTPTPTSGQTDGDAAEPVDYEVVAMPHLTAAGGRTSQMLTPVATSDELDAFVSQLRRDELADEVRAAAADATDDGYDGRLWAAIVSVGCDVPPGVFVEEGEAGYLVTPLKVVDPLEECFAPVTTVALVAIR